MLSMMLAIGTLPHPMPLQSLKDTTNLQFLVLAESNLLPVAGAEVRLMEAGDHARTGRSGIAQFATPEGAPANYFPKGVAFSVEIVHPNYEIYRFRYETPPGDCDCLNSRSWDHYEVRLTALGAVSAPAPSMDHADRILSRECRWELVPNGFHELDCTSHAGDGVNENDALPIACVSYVNGRSPSVAQVQDGLSENEVLEGPLTAELSGRFAGLGFQVRFGGGKTTVSKSIAVSETLGAAELPGCSGEVCLRPKVLQFDLEELCEVIAYDPIDDRHYVTWLPSGNTKTIYLMQGICTDVSQLTGCD